MCVCFGVWLCKKSLAQTNRRPALGEGAGQGLFRLSALLLRPLQHLRLRQQGGLELGRRSSARDLQAVRGVAMGVVDSPRHGWRGPVCLVAAFGCARRRLSGTLEVRASLAQNAEA